MIELIPIADLTLLDKNPRKITSEQMDKLVASLKNDPEFFNLRPCLVNKIGDKLTVYAGNQRVRAAKKLKWKSVPCIVSTDLDIKIIKERTIKDNKTYGEFDFDLLANEWDVDLLYESGFSMDELDISIELPKDEQEEEEPHKCPSCGKKMKK